MPEDRFQNRVNEAIDSITFAQDNTSILQFVENTEGADGILKAAKEIHEITVNNTPSSLSLKQSEVFLAAMRAVAEDLKVH